MTGCLPDPVNFTAVVQDPVAPVSEAIAELKVFEYAGLLA